MSTPVVILLFLLSMKWAALGLFVGRFDKLLPRSGDGSGAMSREARCGIFVEYAYWHRLSPRTIQFSF